MARPAGHPARLLALAAGFLLWHLALVLLYALFSIGCEAGWHRVQAGPLDLQRLVLLAVWLVHLAAIALFLRLAWRRRRRDRQAGGDGCDGDAIEGDRFLGRLAVGLTAWALLSAIGLGLPLLGTTACL